VAIDSPFSATSGFGQLALLQLEDGHAAVRGDRAHRGQATLQGSIGDSRGISHGAGCVGGWLNRLLSPRGSD
jgi:hypothetical protein